jgi:hypothetical protein
VLQVGGTRDKGLGGVNRQDSFFFYIFSFLNILK